MSNLNESPGKSLTENPGSPSAEIGAEAALSEHTVIEFSRISEPYGCFSNFSRYAIIVDDVRWPTSEHYFQAQKFAGYDPAWMEAIREQKSPMAAAMKGRSRKHPIRPDWNEVKNDVMRRAIVIKTLAHAEVRETLESTGDRIIVEKRARDSYWGCGRHGTGKNMLGKIWMEVREVLRSGVAADTDAVERYLKGLKR